MQRSTDRILTTHTGSLPRPPELTRLYARQSRGEAVDAAEIAAAGHAALRAIGELTERKAEQPLRLAGRLRATLSFSQIDEIMASGPTAYVDSIRWQCAQAHTAIHQVYFDYSVESALVA